jgi:CDP-6-deoxy-D-xylo-4-hexulose-3-dehydrase
MEQFSGNGVEIRPVIAGNMQRQPFYAKYVAETFDLKGTEFIHECGFYFGNYPELTESDLDMLKSCLRKY